MVWMLEYAWPLPQQHFPASSAFLRPIRTTVRFSLRSILLLCPQPCSCGAVVVVVVAVVVVVVAVVVVVVVGQD